MRKSIPGLSPLAGGLLAIFGIPWLVEAPPWSLPLSSYDILPVCSSISNYSLYLRTPDILEERSTLFQYDFILTNYIYNDPINKHSHILRCWGLWHQPINWGNTIHVSTSWLNSWSRTFVNLRICQCFSLCPCCASKSMDPYSPSFSSTSFQYFYTIRLLFKITILLPKVFKLLFSPVMTILGAKYLLKKLNRY